MKKLSEGQSAPLFKTKDINDKSIDLQDYRGKHVLLSFFRYAGCPWCNLAIYRLSQLSERLEKEGITIICFIQSNKESIVENIYNRHTPKPSFRIVADSKKEFYKKYGVKDSILAGAKSLVEIPDWIKASKELKFPQSKIDGSLFLVPAQFVIDEQGIITKAHYGANYNDEMSFIEIYNAKTFGIELPA